MVVEKKVSTGIHGYQLRADLRTWGAHESSPSPSRTPCVAGLPRVKGAYRKLPVAGIPRILRPRKRYGTVRGFSVVDPGGN